MTVQDLTKKMIDNSEGNLHDINHFMKVYAYARLIGELEKLDANTQTTLEVAALLHDIACPLCRVKYGNTNGEYQEKEGTLLAAELLKETGCSDELINRVVYLVGHHHTLKGIVGLDYQILIEADYIVNADESSYTKENIKNMMTSIFKTPTGIALLKSIYRL